MHSILFHYKFQSACLSFENFQPKFSYNDWQYDTSLMTRMILTDERSNVYKTWVATSIRKLKLVIIFLSEHIIPLLNYYTATTVVSTFTNNNNHHNILKGSCQLWVLLTDKGLHHGTSEIIKRLSLERAKLLLAYYISIIETYYINLVTCSIPSMPK